MSTSNADEDLIFKDLGIGYVCVTLTYPLPWFAHHSQCQIPHSIIEMFLQPISKSYHVHSLTILITFCVKLAATLRSRRLKYYAVVTPLRKAASYEPRITIFGIWSDTWLTRGKYGIYVAVRGSYGALTGSTWRLLPRKISPIYCRVSYVAVTRIPSVSAA